MNRLIRTVLLLAAAGALLLLSAASVFAVPPAPEAGISGEFGCISETGPRLVTPDDIPVRSAAPGAGRNAPLIKRPKSLPLLCIVVGFRNVPYSTDLNWNESVFSGERSVQNYYTDMSFGQFTFFPAEETSAYGTDGNTNTGDAVNDGIIHVSIPNRHENWSQDEKGNRQFLDGMAAAFVAAINEADRYFDFAAYDANKNGSIETNELAICFIAAGNEGAASNVPDETHLWSHQSELDSIIKNASSSIPYAEPDGTHVSTYVATAEHYSPGRQNPVCVLAHELGHYLGLMDLYDVNHESSAPWSDYQINDASLMANNWVKDENGDYTIISLDAWSRSKLDWYTPEVLQENGEYTLTCQDYDANRPFNVLKIPTQFPWEYYLLENRQLRKWDTGLMSRLNNDSPPQGGIILWHIDERKYERFREINAVNVTRSHPSAVPLFAERGEDGRSTFIGRVVNHYYCFSTSMMRQYCPDCDGTISLTRYDPFSPDLPENRVYSGLTVTILDDCADAMRIRFKDESDGHTILRVQETAPTCEGEGAKAHFECLHCLSVFAEDGNRYREILPEELVIPALGHTEPNAYGRCGHCGKILDDVCVYCGETHSGHFARLMRLFHEILYFFRRRFQPT